MIFSKLFYCSGRRQQKLSKKVVFLGFQKRQNEAVEKRCFSRISEATLDTAMVFEAGGSRVLAAWKVEVLNL